MNTIQLNSITDSRGSLISLEANLTVPFDIKRVYYLFDLTNSPRGLHAHLELNQLMICINGSCKIKLDDGYIKTEVILNNPSNGVLINKLVWREMSDFSKDCKIIVLASDLYKESDYIRNYNDFINIVHSKNRS